MPKNKNPLRLFYLEAVLFSCFFCFSRQVCFAAPDSLKLSVLLDKSEYRQEEPINALFKLENKSKMPIYVNKRFYLSSENMPKEKKDLFLIVTSPSGAKLPCKFSYETGFPKSDYFVLLEPGKEVVSEYPRNLRGYFDFDGPGTYKVAAVYENVYGKEIGLDAFKDKIRSTAVSLRIVKPDSDKERLEKK